jgi:GNAT superfamily N-acetyltransferase
MIILRRAEPRDAASTWSVRAAAIRELCKSDYGAAEVAAWASTPLPDRHVAAMSRESFLVAEQDGAVVGFGIVNTETTEIEALFVHPDSARRGIGRQLLAGLEDIARGARLTSLHLSASLNAVRFYETAGYQIVERTVYRHPSGLELACVAMRKSLLSGQGEQG